MSYKYHHVFYLFLIFLIPQSIYSQNNERRQVLDSVLVTSVVTFIDDWHNQAATADIAYFDKIAANGIYIGTDASELWNKEEFILWSKKYFEQGKAWSFTTIERNVYFSDDKQYAWFDELLETQMGVCRASGVLKRKGNSWEIEHYHLSITIPNEKLDQVIEVVLKD